MQEKEKKWMWMETVKSVLMVIVGAASGFGIAAGLFAFIVGLGVISDFADRTHTGKYVMLYEDSIILGGILGNLFWIYQMNCLQGMGVLLIWGLFSGIFVGCWSMALADILNIFPIFIRRAKISTGLSWLILAMAFGKSIGSLLYFYMRW